MTKYLHLLIFLLCVSFAYGTTVRYVVGGAGTGAGRDGGNAGFYDSETIGWADMQDANGDVLGFDTDAASTNNGGKVRLTGDGNDFDNVIVGVGVVCDFAENESPDGYWLVTAVPGGDVIDIDADFVGDGEACNVQCGGAMANPGDVPDSSDVNGNGWVIDESAGVHKIWIRALADYTTEDEGQDTILYCNIAGGSDDPITWEGHFAEITTNGEGEEIGDFGIATFDAGVSGLANCIKTAVGGAVNHTFIGISCERATDDGLNGNAELDDFILLIRCQFINNGVWGVNADNEIGLVFCDIDGNGSNAATDGGVSVGGNIRIMDSVSRNNTGAGIFTAGVVIAINNLLFDNSGTIGLTGNFGGGYVFYGNTIDKNNVANSIGIKQDDGFGVGKWYALNNVLIDCATGISDDVSLGQNAVLSNNLYSSNTADTNANIFPTPIDGDNQGNVVDPANVFDPVYILHADNKGKGVDASYTKAYWDDFDGGAGDNPPSPLLGLSFMDMGALQREEAGGGGGGRTPGIGKGIGG